MLPFLYKNHNPFKITVLEETEAIVESNGWLEYKQILEIRWKS